VLGHDVPARLKRIVGAQERLSSFPEGRGHAAAIGWRSGTSSALLFRKANDILDRMAEGKRHGGMAAERVR
jgi:hypothetical protein